MKHFFLVAIVLLSSIAFSQKTEKQWEQEYLNLPNPSFAYEHLAYYTSLPHVAGTYEDYQTAVYTALKFEEYGFDEVVIEEEEVLLSYPISRSVKLTSPSTYECVMEEDYEPIDPTSDDPRAIPTFLGYSPNGTAEGELVYVNYGSLDDFNELEKLGIDVKGKIGIARYGSIFRGTKAMIAQERGMIGLLIYSDPADDGYAQGPVYPEGPWRSNSSVQRGSVLFLSICPGNPTRDVCVEEELREHYSYTEMMPKIPVQALSYSDAYPLMKALEGSTEAPSSFQGALPITYSLGPGPATVSLSMQMKFVNSSIWNVIATLNADSSSSYQSQQILLGNHRDAWVFGAVDPNSGTSVLLEVARSFGELKKQGWRPQRQIILCSWDGEEYGLLGSTAYAERHNQSLIENAVAYLNLDTAIAGSSFSAISSPSLQSLIRNVTKDVIDPQSGLPLSEVWNGEVGPMGSGSDYTAFLDHLGIPCLNVEFDGDYGVYHSVYDSMHWMLAFGDPTFEYHVLCAQIFGLMTMRLADIEVLSLNFTDYAQSLHEYAVISKQLAVTYNITNLDYSPLLSAISSFNQSAYSLHSLLQSGDYDNEINERMTQTERMFIGPGLPKRPYYKHVVQAPGLYQGYSPEVYPGVNQAIRSGNQLGAQAEIYLTASYISKAAAYLAGNSQSF